MQDFLKTWEGTQAENRWNRIVILGLVVALMFLAVQTFSRETVVTIQPWTLAEEAWITNDDASQSYKEAWGWALATLVGNVTPASVDYIKDRITPLVTPEMFSDVVSALEVQARQIKLDRVTMRFEPRFVEYEPESGKVFVYGYSFTKGVSSEEIRRDRTYEYIIKISQFAPVIAFMDTYPGKPKTQVVLEKLEREQEAKRDREGR